MAAGIRRIEAITADNVTAYYRKLEAELGEASMALKTTPEQLTERIKALLAEVKNLQSENESLKSKAARESLGNAEDSAVEIKGIKFLAMSVDNVDMNGLRELGDSLKEKLGKCVVVLASGQEGKVNLMAMASDDAVKEGAHAGNLVKALAGYVGGGGGGRPNMAQAGGKNPAGIPQLIKEAPAELEKLLA